MAINADFSDLTKVALIQGSPLIIPPLRGGHTLFFDNGVGVEGYAYYTSLQNGKLLEESRNKVFCYTTNKPFDASESYYFGIITNLISETLDGAVYGIYLKWDVGEGVAKIYKFSASFTAGTIMPILMSEDITDEFDSVDDLVQLWFNLNVELDESNAIIQITPHGKDMVETSMSKLLNYDGKNGLYLYTDSFLESIGMDLWVLNRRP